MFCQALAALLERSLDELRSEQVLHALFLRYHNHLVRVVQGEAGVCSRLGKWKIDVFEPPEILDGSLRSQRCVVEIRPLRANVGKGDRSWLAKIRGKSNIHNHVLLH
jgi:hypothetical protein